MQKWGCKRNSKNGKKHRRWFFAHFLHFPQGSILQTNRKFASALLERGPDYYSTQLCLCFEHGSTNTDDSKMGKSKKPLVDFHFLEKVPRPFLQFERGGLRALAQERGAEHWSPLFLSQCDPARLSPPVKRHASFRQFVLEKGPEGWKGAATRTQRIKANININTQTSRKYRQLMRWMNPFFVRLTFKSPPLFDLTENSFFPSKLNWGKMNKGWLGLN